MTLPSSRAIALVFLVSVTLSACASPRDSAALTTTGSAVETSVSAADGNSSSLRWIGAAGGADATLDVSLARTTQLGVEYRAKPAPPASAGPGGDVALAVAPDGALVVVRVPSDQYSGGAGIDKSSTLGSFDGDFHAWPSTAGMVEGDPPRQIFAADAEGSSAVWAETASTEVVMSSWRIFSRDASGRVALVARSEEVDGRAVGDLAPVIADDRVYWATAALASDGTPEMQIQSRELDGSGPIRVDAHGATNPTPTSAGMYVSRTSRDNPNMPDSEAEIARIEPGGQLTPVLAVGGASETSVGELVGTGDWLAFTTFSSDPADGALRFVNVRTRDTVTVPMGSQARRVYVTACSDAFAWINSDGSGADGTRLFRYGLSDGDLTVLDVGNQLPAPLCSGNTLALRTSDPETQQYGTWVAEWAH